MEKHKSQKVAASWQFFGIVLSFVFLIKKAGLANPTGLWLGGPALAGLAVVAAAAWANSAELSALFPICLCS